MRKHYGLLDQPSADLGPDANYFLMLQTDVGSFLLFFFLLACFPARSGVSPYFPSYIKCFPSFLKL